MDLLSHPPLLPLAWICSNAYTFALALYLHLCSLLQPWEYRASPTNKHRIFLSRICKVCISSWSPTWWLESLQHLSASRYKLTGLWLSLHSFWWSHLGYRPNIMSLLIFAADCSLVDYRRLKTIARQRAEFWFSAVTFLLLWNGIFLTIQQFPIVLWNDRSYIWTTTVA